jgi:hypothetical protein
MHNLIDNKRYMKRIALLQIYVITPLWTLVKTTTPLEPKHIKLLLIS